MSGRDYLGKDARAETDFDRWLARAQHKAKMRQVEAGRFGAETDFDTPHVRYDEVEERWLEAEEL